MKSTKEVTELYREIYTAFNKDCIKALVDCYFDGVRDTVWFKNTDNMACEEILDEIDGVVLNDWLSKNGYIFNKA